MLILQFRTFVKIEDVVKIEVDLREPLRSLQYAEFHFILILCFIFSSCVFIDLF